MLRLLAAVAHDAGRKILARNFERAAKLVAMPAETIMQIYEGLQPGRRADRRQLLDKVDLVQREFGAERIAALLEEAAEVHERRGLFWRRY